MGADGLPEILQENHYYPFGMAMTMSSTLAAAPPNNYLYNGKELQDELGLGWYDYGARMYDVSVGRWNGVDALAEGTSAWTPYRYGFNNPLIFTDPTGNSESHYVDKEGNYLGEDNTRTTDVKVIDRGNWNAPAARGTGAKMSDGATMAVRGFSTDLTKYKGEGGIHLSDDAVESLETNGAEIPEVTVDNQSNGEVYAVDEYSKFNNDGDMTPFRVDPGKQSYVPLDAFKTASHPENSIYKVAGGERVTVSGKGDVVIHNKQNIGRAGNKLFQAIQLNPIPEYGNITVAQDDSWTKGVGLVNTKPKLISKNP